MATNYKKIETGVNVVPKSASTSDSLGDIEVLSSTNKATLHNGSSASPIVTEAHSATLTNKTIDADSNTITNIENTDIKAAAGIEFSKLEPLASGSILVGNASNEVTEVAVSGDITLSNTGVAAIATDVIVNADINSSAGIVDTKLATISTVGKVSNSATTATDANTASAIVARDASGNFSAGTITASLTGSASNNVLKAGDTMTGNLIMDNQTEVRFREGSGGGTNYAALRAPATLAADYTLTLPANDGDADQFLQTDGSGVLTWASGGGGGGLAAVAPGSVINSNYTIVSGDNGRTLNVDTSGGTINITLPAPSAGFKVTVKDYKGTSGANSIVIIRNGSELIDFTASDETINEAYRAISLVSDGTNWYRIASFTGVIPAASQLGTFAGGRSGATTYNVIDYVQIAVAANATDFGDLTVARRYLGACASASRGLFGGGSTPTAENTIDYITFSSAGNATDFGDLTVARANIAGCSSSTRGIFSGSGTNVIDYVDITSAGNATDFGDLTVARDFVAGSSSPTRGIFSGGNTGAVSNVIDYITIASASNATDFGDLTVSRDSVAGCSSSTRGLTAGGYAGTTSNVIDYVTIASVGNATDFGDLTAARDSLAACSSPLRAVFAGGENSGGTALTTADYVQIASASNATSFGDITVARFGLAGCSNSHGGL